jgi:drug/metabolite transporter (DMT)-like permease
MNRTIERTAMVLAIAFIIALLVSTLSRLNISSRFFSAPMLSFLIVAIITVIVRLGCGWWLYKTTTPRQQYPWLWCLLGVVVGLMAVATYYIIQIYKYVSVPAESPDT